MLSAVLIITGCGNGQSSQASVSADRGTLVGAWRSKIVFRSGPLAEMRDLEFLYAYNAGGTMTESSNYDAMPPVTPAYGVWKKTGPKQYEARYVYYWTKPPAALEEITKGGGWSPGGHGVLTQNITLSDDGSSFDSTIKYEVFDQTGKPTDPSSEASAQGTRIKP